MVYPTIKVKNAYIEKHLNRFYDDEEHYDYFLLLDEKTYNEMKKEGLPAKAITRRLTGEPIYFILVKPVWEFDENNTKIPVPEEEFLNRDDIDITFFIYTARFKEKDIKRLYFRKSGIKEKRMSKYIDDFNEFTNELRRDLELGKINGDTVRTAYLVMIAGYLATIVDQLNEMNNKEDENG